MEFDEKVYKALRKVPRGKVTTYKELAKAIHSKAYRAVGGAMKRNPSAPEIPCHRVVRSDGSIGGFGGQTKGRKINEKIALLRKEGVEVSQGKIVDFEKRLYRWR
ncbi:MGMT family protein [Candidatus Woesearchaeota archaeon]|nr:MGMT family protein [Candidatus Woesearchaeota archaeon]